MRVKDMHTHRHTHTTTTVCLWGSAHRGITMNSWDMFSSRVHYVAGVVQVVGWWWWSGSSDAGLLWGPGWGRDREWSTLPPSRRSCWHQSGCPLIIRITEKYNVNCSMTQALNTHWQKTIFRYHNPLSTCYSIFHKETTWTLYKLARRPFSEQWY